jgi:hypothetical protein
MDDITRDEPGEFRCSIKTYDGIRDKRKLNYEVISDYSELESFIQWLPELRPHEMYYIVLLARNKYCGELTHIKSDREQLKRLLVTKETLLDKLRQMECPLGSYKQKDTEIPQEALAVYINPNPRDLIKGAKETLKELVDKVVGPDQIYNAQSIAMTNIHRSKSRTMFAHFDYDHIELQKWMDDMIDKYINVEALTIIKTRGGFHVLVDSTKVDDKYASGWYSMMTVMDLGYIVPTGDMIMPIPGCTQGGYSPFFVLKNGVKQ